MPCISRAEVKYLTNLSPAPGEEDKLNVGVVDMSFEAPMVRSTLLGLWFRCGAAVCRRGSRNISVGTATSYTDRGESLVFQLLCPPTIRCVFVLCHRALLLRAACCSAPP